MGVDDLEFADVEEYGVERWLDGPATSADFGGKIQRRGITQYIYANNHYAGYASQPYLGKLTLELWEWPGGRVLELSTRVSSDAGSSGYTELQRLVSTNQLAMSPDQRVKTSIALEAITHAAVH